MNYMTNSGRHKRIISPYTQMAQRTVKADPYLKPYRNIIAKRLNQVDRQIKKLTSGRLSLSEFASGHLYFGLHFQENQWVFREWAPNAEAIYLIGDMSQWKPRKKYMLKRLNDEGHWEIRLPAQTFKHEDMYKLFIQWPDGEGERIPSYAQRVVQDPVTKLFSAQVWAPPKPYVWKCGKFKATADPALIYEAHVGMAQEEGRVGTYREFTRNIIPRIVKSGYNTIQIMAIQEHPYYGSFGYHVSSFFSASSRFGTPEDLKELVDTAHSAGLTVVMDLIHSHAANNEIEGLSRFDGTLYQYFHDNPRGRHEAWDSRCFDYGKHQVLHFLLSNCKFWLEEYRFDGFRFDGITSMLYLDHGLGKAFTSYDDYFGPNVDEDALTYLAIANRLIHEVRPDALTIAEDISGMPGLASPISKGGIGFDYRMAMGVPDLWIKLVKEMKDEDWPLGFLWHELNNRRHDENTISYAESHDQALVGDKTLIFRMADADMYHHMHINSQSLSVDRATALHKMIRLITLSTAGNGYLNFMGNEFGHPEWIDFPRQGNNWSYHYARRQWHLVDNPELKYQFLDKFDKEMLKLAKQFDLIGSSSAHLLYEHVDNKLIAFKRGELIFIFNFHPVNSYTDYRIEAPSGQYRLVLDSDSKEFGGHGRLTADQMFFTKKEKKPTYERHLLSLYLPTRTALALEPVESIKKKKPK